MRALLILALGLLAANVGWRLLRGDEAPLWKRTPAAVAGEGDRASVGLRAGAGVPEAAVAEAAPAPDVPSWPGNADVPPVAQAPEALPPTDADDPRVSAAAAGGRAPVAASARPSPPGLIVPVRGIRAADLQDTFGDSRSGERTHEALDIMAPAGTPVLAVADGHVEKLFDSERGGLTIYQFEPTGTWCYYYAHLQSYAPGLAEGAQVKQGDVIGFVGSTGNADPAAPHLHFAVFALTPEKQWWTGAAVNPYPLLRGADTR
ncbi:M23 family metallopeptidase [Luteimonas marina]|uniref:M23 family metallopeptidase n=1 Tax=Luteimonas marina TaxID=488485 RepID=UPI003CCD4E46